MYIIYLFCLVLVEGAVVKETQKDDHCTDPRTMRKHAAYTEWADAYSCTRHRCQPGGRNLAIYTVGCKRVEAPESAIECEEVVEDTNMQFPYCCTRLRCLVVVRGEVWTRVLGQPWETLPAAPWSHMYKMKKPPPVDTSFLPKNAAPTGPVYELSEDKASTDRRANEKDCDKPIARALPPSSPDIVIALTTNGDKKSNQDSETSKFLGHPAFRHDDPPTDIEAEEAPTITEKVPEIFSEEHMAPPSKKTPKDQKIFPVSDDEQPNYRGLKEKLQKVPQTAETSSDEMYNTNKRPKKPKIDALSEEHVFPNAAKKSPRGPKSWARIPQDPWDANPSRSQSRVSETLNEFEKDHETFPKVDAPVFHGESEEKPEEAKPASLQHLVNAIGTRMRDIENVVQQMSEKVTPPLESIERYKMRADRAMPRPNENPAEAEPLGIPKKPNSETYNRFPPQQGVSKYLRGELDTTTTPPLFVGDNLNGYFSDPSNNLLRRAMAAKAPKEPQGTYMAPINTERKKSLLSDSDDEADTRHKKHIHKKKKSRHGKKKHRREEREKKKFNKLPAEFEKNAVSMEESNDFGTEREAMKPQRSGWAPLQQSFKSIRILQTTAGPPPIKTRRPMVTNLSNIPIRSYGTIANHRRKSTRRAMATSRPKRNNGPMLNYPPFSTDRPMMSYRPITNYGAMTTNRPTWTNPYMVTNSPMQKYGLIANNHQINYRSMHTHRPFLKYPATKNRRLETKQPMLTYQRKVTNRTIANYIPILTPSPITEYQSLPNYRSMPTHRSMKNYRLDLVYRIMATNKPMATNRPLVNNQPMAIEIPMAIRRPMARFNRPMAVNRAVVINRPMAYNRPMAINQPMAINRPILANWHRNQHAHALSRVQLLMTPHKTPVFKNMRDYKKDQYRIL